MHLLNAIENLADAHVVLQEAKTTMIKQTTTAMLLTAVVAAIAIPHTSMADRNNNPFRDESLNDIQGNSNPKWHYKKYTQKNKKRRKRSSRNKKRRSVSPLITEGIKVQKALRSMGHYDAPLDGKLDSYESRVAIMQFQKRYSLPLSGELAPEVEEVLLQQGDITDLSAYLEFTGDNQKERARQVQAALTAQGFFASTIDGDFGPKSRAAMRLYQEANDLVPSGALLPEQEEKLVTDSTQLLQNEQALMEQTLAGIAARSGSLQEVSATQTVQLQQQPVSGQSFTPMHVMDRFHPNPEIATETPKTGKSVTKEVAVLKAEADTSSETLEWLPADTELIINSIEGDWAHVSVNGQQGYVYAVFLEIGKTGGLSTVEIEDDKFGITTEAPKTEKVVITEMTVLKAEADAASATVVGLSPGVELTVNSMESDWAHVSVNDQQGYVYAEFLEMRKERVAGD